MLIRLVGPFFGFLAAARAAGVPVSVPSRHYLRELALRYGVGASIAAGARSSRLTPRLKGGAAGRMRARRLPTLEFSNSALEQGRLCILIPHTLVSYAQNLQYKWEEGLYFAPPFVSDYLAWVHGTFQVRQTLRVRARHVDAGAAR